METRKINSTPQRKTKIVATVGPASCQKDKIKELILAGVNVFRLNFSHGSHELHFESLTHIRDSEKELGISVAILQDLSGPKIRITGIPVGNVIINDGDVIEVVHGSSDTTAKIIYVEGLNPPEFMQAGEVILLNDGFIVLEATKVEASKVTCKIIKGGKLRGKVGIAFPQSKVELGALTEKDFFDAEWGVQNNVDYMAVSFVKDAADLHNLRAHVKKHGGDIPLVSKIERKEALVNLDEIVEASDGLMVARGDLGLEVPLEQLPRLQKEIIEKGNYKGIPVIVATQMLSSMVTAIRPTRAEVSDVANAVMQGADAIMLSEESAVGENPVNCVEYLSRIAVEAEKTFEFEEYKLRLRGVDRETIADSVAYAACAAAVKISASALISCTASGRSARLIAKYRPQQALYGSSSHDKTLRRMCLYWGVRPIFTSWVASHQAEVSNAVESVKARDGLVSGSCVVVIGGIVVGKPGATSVMEIKTVE